MCGLVGMYSQNGEYNSGMSEIIADMKKNEGSVENKNLSPNN